MAAIRLHRSMPASSALHVLKLARLIAETQDRFLEAAPGSDVERRLVERRTELEAKLSLACCDILLLKERR